MIVIDRHQDNLKRPRRKWYKAPSEKDGICFHHTAVRGGAGTSKRRRKRYEEYAHTNEGGEPWGDHDRAVKAMALSDRYAGQGHGPGWSYHAIYNPNVDVLFLNLPFDLRSHHGNGANTKFVGFAWDELSTNPKHPLNALRLQEAVRRVVAHGQARGHFKDGLEFTCHSAWTNKPHDPGKAFIRRVLIPLADELDAEINLDFVAKRRGKQIRGARSIREVADL